MWHECRKSARQPCTVCYIKLKAINQQCIYDLKNIIKIKVTPPPPPPPPYLYPHSGLIKLIQFCENKCLNKGSVKFAPLADLHPEEEFALGGLELEDVHSPCGALGDMLELHIVREDNKILLHTTHHYQYHRRKKKRRRPKAPEGEKKLLELYIIREDKILSLTSYNM